MRTSPRYATLLATALLLAVDACSPKEEPVVEVESTAGAEEVTPLYPGPCTVQIDYDVDGTVDEIERYAYDDAGHVTREEDDTDGDGTADAIVTHSYDDAGHRVRSESDRNADGTVDAASTYVYEGDLLVREETDSDGDGTANATRVITYDESARPVREELDDNGDGRPDRVLTFTYDEATGLLAERHQGFEQRAYEYDESGRLVREVISSRTRRRRQYRVQSVVVYEYDEAGRRTLEQYETPRGDVATYNRYQYDDRGGLVRLESDGEITTSAIEYDEAGNRLREEMDEVGEKSLRTYGYDCF